MLLQCIYCNVKQISSLVYAFFIRLRKLKNIHFGRPPLISKNIFFDSFTLVYICLHLSTFVYNRLDSSSDSSTLVYIRLVACLHSSTFVYTLLDSSSDSSVFLEQICFRKVKQRTITYLITWSYLRRFQSVCGYKSFSISTKFWILPTLLLGLLRGDIFLFGRFENILYN